MTFDLKHFGDRAPTPGGRKVAAVPTAKTAQPPIPLDRYFRNGKAPDATAVSMMRNAANQAMCFRTKAAFEWTSLLGQASGIGQSSGGAGTRARFRFAMHTGPYHHALYVRTFIYPQTAGFNSNAYVAVTIYSDASESTLVSTSYYHYGNNPLNTLNVAGWQYMKCVNQYVDGLTADTDYYVVVSDGDNGLVQSISAADLQSATENNSGWLASNYTQESLILASDRRTILEPIPSLWKRSGGKILNWTADLRSSPRTIAVNTATNIIDGSTTYSGSVPGFYFEMTGKARLSQTGVPIAMKAYMKCTSAANGVLHLRDSSGTIKATCTNTYGAGVAGWIGTTATIPASLDKYYLTFQTAAGTMSLGAVSIYEYE